MGEEGYRQNESGLFVPVFQPFEVDNKLRHVEGKYRGIGTTCPDGKITRVNTKHLPRINGLPEEEWDTALFDILNLVGASKGFIDQQTRNSSLDQLEFLVRGHDIRRYTLIDHERCAAYARMLENSPLRDNEFLFHVHCLQSAYHIIKKGLPNLDVILVYAHIVGDKIRYVQIPPGSTL